MTKAERIFMVTWSQCKKHMRTWGKQYNPNGRPISFNGLCCNDNESISVRTLNDIQKFVDRRRRQVIINDTFGIGTVEAREDQVYILDAVQVAVDNSREILISRK